jgi:DNA-binding MarR family transcriptional regulator
MGSTLSSRLQQPHFADEYQESTLWILVLANTLQSSLETLCAAHGITGTQYNVLRILRGVHPHGHSRESIKQRMINQSPDVTRLTDRLIAMGLATRIPHPLDKRRVQTSISKKGLAVLENMQPDIDKLNQKLRKALNTQEAQRLSLLCERVFNALP